MTPCSCRITPLSVPQPYGTNTASNGRTDPDRVITAGNIAWRDKIDRFSDQLIVGRPHRKSHTYAGNAEGIVSAAKRLIPRPLPTPTTKPALVKLTLTVHIGCLRVLDRLGLLIDVLSTVSGGSVIGAFFHAHDGDFASFRSKDARDSIRASLGACAGKLLSPLGLKVAAAFALIGVVAVVVALIRTILGILKSRTSFFPILANSTGIFQIRRPIWCAAKKRMRIQLTSTQ